MHHSTMFDQNGDPCLMVIKHGNTTCLTIGYINDICSYARNYYGNNSEICKERAIFPSGTKSGVFSAEDDSGSAIVDGFGRIISANSSPAVPAPRLPRTRAVDLGGVDLDNDEVFGILLDTDIDVDRRARGAVKYGGRADDNGARAFSGRHDVLDKVLKGLEGASVFIC
jgi:hypothetical protein